MYSAEYFIKSLGLEKHVEGGYFKQTFVSGENITSNDLGTKFEGERKLWTSIYFLLKDGEVSNFHRLKSDEMWYYHAGSPLTVYTISPEGNLTTHELGLNIENGELPQVLVPKNYIFGSAMNHEGFSLVGCMVSPGFEFKDFELFEREYLLGLYPEHEEVILKLTRSNFEPSLEDSSSKYATVKNAEARRILSEVERLFNSNLLNDEDRDELFRKISNVYFESKRKKL